MGEWLTTLTFTQLLILIGIAVGLLGVAGAFVWKRGLTIKRKDTTYILGDQGQRIKVNKQEVLNALIVVEALKIKDSIQEVDEIVFRYQKRLTRELLPRAQQLQLSSFRNLLSDKYRVESDFREEFVITHRDYLYYSLLVEKMYTNVFADLMDSFEKNGLSKVGNNFAREKASLFLEEGFQKILNALYMGIESVPKADHDRMIADIRFELLQVLVDILQRAIQASVRGARKKDTLKNQIIAKIGEMEGISEQQIRNLFSNVVAEDFLSSDGSDVV